MSPSKGWKTILGGALLAIVVAGTPARAGCNPEDLASGVWDALKATSTCKTACETQAGCAAAMALAGALSMAALQGSDTGKGQVLVDQFCSQAQGSTQQVVQTLNSVFGNFIAESVLGDLSTKLSAVTSIASVVKCGCQAEQGFGSLGEDLMNCVEEALCWGQELLGGGSCDCERPAPAVAQCPSFNTKACAGMDLLTRAKHPECTPGGSIANCNDKWQQCGYAGYTDSVSKIETPQGTLAIRSPPTEEGTGCNEGVISCFCPKPMIPAWHEVANPGSGDHRFIFTCDCPSGTHPGPTMPDGLSQCLCDETEKPANMGFAPFGMCPPPECPAGQSRLGVDGPCVTPCADPTQGMAFDGTCCNPAQLATCGQCCPPDTYPDPKSGSCKPRPQQPK